MFIRTPFTYIVVWWLVGGILGPPGCRAPSAAGRSAIVLLLPRRGVSSLHSWLAAGGHQREGIVQKRLHSLTDLFNGRLRGHILCRGRAPGKRARVFTQLRHWCGVVGWQIWVRLQERKRQMRITQGSYLYTIQYNAKFINADYLIFTVNLHFAHFLPLLLHCGGGLTGERYS